MRWDFVLCLIKLVSAFNTYRLLLTFIFLSSISPISFSIAKICLVRLMFLFLA